VFGGEPILLTDPLPAGGSILDYMLAPDGSRIAFYGDAQTLGVIEVFSADLPVGIPEPVHGMLLTACALATISRWRRVTGGDSLRSGGRVGP
jgi:hypothetical protein